MLHRAIPEVAESDTNQSIKQKQSTKPPTKQENRPPAIQPTVFKKSGAGEGIDPAVDDRWERMFEEFGRRILRDALARWTGQGAAS